MSLPKVSLRSGQAEILIILLLLAVGLFFSGGLLTFDKNKTVPKGTQTITLDNANTPQKNLQLRTINITSECSKTKAVDLLIDDSGSMDYPQVGSPTNKINSLKTALGTFIQEFNDDDIIGIQAFNISPFQPLAIQKFSTVRLNGFQNALSTIIPGQPGTATYLKEGMSFAKEKLTEAKANSDFKDYNFALILFSDGIPEVNLPSGDSRDGRLCRDTNGNECSPVQLAGAPHCRCFAYSQDPTDPDGASVADEIKAMGVKVYSVALLESDDHHFDTELINLLRKSASEPKDKYFKPALSSNDLVQISKDITKDLCSE